MLYSDKLPKKFNKIIQQTCASGGIEIEAAFTFAARDTQYQSLA